MRKNIKILVFTDAFSGGGAEEVMGTYSQFLHQHYQVLHLSKWKGPKQYVLPYWKISLDRSSLKSCILPLLIVLRRYQPKIVFTSTGHNNILFLLFKLFWFRNMKVIIRESSIASVMNQYTWKARLMNRFLVQPLYRMADVVIVQSSDMQYDLLTQYGLLKEKVVLLQNPVLNPSRYVREPNVAFKTIQLLHIGRFSKEKGHHRLLDIFAQLPHSYHLQLIGDGPLLESIKAYAQELNVADRVNFLGFLQEEAKLNVILQSNLYVQTSYVEGFPNALAQVVSMGIPAIAFDVPGGTKEILCSTTGLLIEDGALTNIAQAIQDTNWSSFDPNAMREVMLQKFGEKACFAKLLNVFENERKK
ncbi:glycosyltransferase [Flavobacterium sp. LMO8]|uniref:glycosyltransferase n=1 Tax=Flavobacterium sp. LMO8 TaxID=2654244 RepID=UPI0012929A90|nr:glycosyltransferase [Flavobacterium sp. LMO8]MQP24732.1 glycosyltransferase [Flavobacterium sp. LMO8]